MDVGACSSCLVRDDVKQGAASPIRRPSACVSGPVGASVARFLGARGRLPARRVRDPAAAFSERALLRCRGDRQHPAWRAGGPDPAVRGGDRLPPPRLRRRCVRGAAATHRARAGEHRHPVLPLRARFDRRLAGRSTCSRRAARRPCPLSRRRLLHRRAGRRAARAVGRAGSRRADLQPLRRHTRLECAALDLVVLGFPTRQRAHAQQALRR